MRGNLGQSIRTNRPVAQVIGEQLPSTIQLALAAMPLAILIGSSLGLLAALKRNSWIDTAAMGLAISRHLDPQLLAGHLIDSDIRRHAGLAAEHSAQR